MIQIIEELTIAKQGFAEQLITITKQKTYWQQSWIDLVDSYA